MAFTALAYPWLALLLAFHPLASGTDSPLENAARNPQPANQDLVIFSAMGDVPYTLEEEVLLSHQLAALPQKSEFVVHVGDIQPEGRPCDDPGYSRIANQLAGSPLQMFVVPGDNDWSDCNNRDEAWPLWQRYFLRFDELWPQQFPVSRQPGRTENFAFMRGTVLFIGIHLLGGQVGDPVDWRIRHDDNISWIWDNVSLHANSASRIVVLGHAAPTQNHADVILALTLAATYYGGPVLYMHGDGHVWLRDQPYLNIERVQLDRGGFAPPVTVRVTDSPRTPFVFERNLHMHPAPRAR